MKRWGGGWENGGGRERERGEEGRVKMMMRVEGEGMMDTKEQKKQKRQGIKPALVVLGNLCVCGIHIHTFLFSSTSSSIMRFSLIEYKIF